MSIPTQAREVTVTRSPSQTDAQLMVDLAQLGVAMRVERGQALLYKHQQEGGLTYEHFTSAYPNASEDSLAILNVLRWHETIGTLVKQGLLDRGLILDWLWVSGSWDMCKQIALHHREETKSDSMWENFEALAASQNC